MAAKDPMHKPRFQVDDVECECPSGGSSPSHEQEPEQDPVVTAHEHAALLKARPESSTPTRDSEQMVLLRQKLNQIAVGSDKHSRSEFRKSRSHFSLYPTADRPSTPPSSPQPRDVLRKQLLLRSHRNRMASPDNADQSDPSCFNMMEVSVDSLEITPLSLEDDDISMMDAYASPLISVGMMDCHGESKRAINSPDLSILNRYPEGLRKRKSVHIDVDGETSNTDLRLKKTSSEVSLTCTVAHEREDTKASDSFEQCRDQSRGKVPAYT